MFAALMLGIYLLSISGINVHSCSHSGTSISLLINDFSKSSCSSCSAPSHEDSKSTYKASISKKHCCNDEISLLDFSGSTSDNQIQFSFTPSFFAVLNTTLLRLSPVFGLRTIVYENSPPGIVHSKPTASLCTWRV